MLIRISAAHFVAGLIIGPPNICAPIISYMRNWDLQKIKNYCKSKNWNFEKLN